MSMTASADSFADGPLPRRFALPAIRLLPRRVVALDAAQNAVSFALRLHVNGRVTLAPERARSRGGSFVLALDPAICFRRRGRLEPKNRPELRMVAADFFPFGADATTYALSGAGGEETSYCALPTQDLVTILDRFPRAVAVIVAPSDPARLKAAIEERLDRGEVADLLPDSVRLINPAMALSGVLAAVLAISVIGSIMLWSAHEQAAARAGRAELARLEAQTARLFERRQAIVRMAGELQQEQAFAKAPSRGALDLIAKTLAALPAGAYVDRIEYGKDTLTISGWGNGVSDWIKTAGVEPKNVTSEKMPLADRFVITFAIASK